ncbi:WG repeat-containing protein [Acidovorax sp.]
MIPPRFDEAKEFQDGRAAARQGGKWGFINRQGHWQ